MDVSYSPLELSILLSTENHVSTPGSIPGIVATWLDRHFEKSPGSYLKPGIETWHVVPAVV